MSAVQQLTLCSRQPRTSAGRRRPRSRRRHRKPIESGGGQPALSRAEGPPRQPARLPALPTTRGPQMHRILVVATLISASLLFAQDQKQNQISYKAAPNAKERETLLLRDFHPSSMLHARVTPIERAKFPVIDVHNHINDAMGIDEHVPPEQVIKVMNAVNVRTVVILTGQWREKLQKVVDEMV